MDEPDDEVVTAREALERIARDPTLPTARLRPIDTTWPVGYLRVDPATGVTAGIDVVTRDGVRPMVWRSHGVYLVARLGAEYGDRWGIQLDPDEWAIVAVGPVYLDRPPIIEGYLVTSPAVFGDDVPEPPGRVMAPGRDGVGPALDSEAGPARWMLLDGYHYLLRSDDVGRLHIRERPDTFSEDLDPDALA